MDSHKLGSITKNIILVSVPIMLFYFMRIFDYFITLESFIGPSKEAAQVAEYFLYGIIGLIISNLLYPIIKRINNREFAKISFQSLSYPVDYFWNSIILIVLTAKNVNPLVQTPIFTFTIISISSFLQIPVRKFIELKYTDIRQEVYQDSAIRDISLLIIVLVTLMIFIVR